MHTPLNEPKKKEYVALMEIKEQAITNTVAIEEKIELLKDSIAA
jgi:hypothetical protein